jgi:flagellum-specific peptidoglycan hydrolase FlgJ
MTDAEKQFLDKAAAAANAAAHPFPRMAASEAALESRFGLSELATQDNNLFGMKQHIHNAYGVASLPTDEFEKGDWEEVGAEWEKYPDWATCFTDRVSTLTRLSKVYPHYAAALRAVTVDTYIREVSQTWSTDPARADKCLAIYNEYVQTPSAPAPAPTPAPGQVLEES